MGACCERGNKIEDYVEKYFKTLPVCDMDIDRIENLLKSATSANGEIRKMSLSSKAQSILEESKNKISKENFIKLCKNHFINKFETTDNSEDRNRMSQKAQIELFTAIYNCKDLKGKYGDKSNLLLNLLPLVSKQEGKVSKIFDLLSNNEDKMKYALFKSSIFEFIKNTLANPVFSLRETYFDDLVIENDIEEYTEECLNDEDIRQYSESLFEAWERLNYLDKHIGNEGYISKLEAEGIFKDKVKIFDMFELRKMYLTRNEKYI
jgi:hypothetical protein